MLIPLVVFDMINKINMRSMKNIILGMTLALFVAFGACSSDSDGIDDGGENNIGTSDNIVVSIVPERTKLIRNPMSGWVLYSGLGDGLSDTFWEDYDNMQSTVGVINVSDYATTLYIRAAWSLFNPEENVYIWNGNVDTKAAQRLRMLMDGAAERNLKLAFTFVVDSRDKHYNFTPDFVKNAAGIEGYTTTTGSVEVWSPYPDNAVFQGYYETFIKEFAKKFDDPDLVQFVSGFGLGKWGETHSLKYTTGNDDPRESVIDWVSDLYANSFTNVPIVINYHRWIMSLREWDGTNYDSESERILNTLVDKGFSLRHDAFGMKTYYSTWERNYAATQKFKRPIILEGGWVKSSHGSSITGDGYETYADVRQGEYDEGKGAYVNMMDFRYNSNLVNGETFSWFNDAYSLVEEFIAEGGYRLYPDRISVPESVKNGSSVSIEHRWLNLGWGYCPTNIPQWKDKYKVAFALLDKTDFTPKYIFIDDEPELCDWIKGTPSSYTFSTTINNVTTGDYIWAVGLVDETKDNKVGIQISAKSNITSEGWLKIKEVTIR